MHKTPDPASEDSLIQTKSPRKVRQMFSDISPTYDAMNHLLSMNIDKRWRRFVARQVVHSDTSKILDVCGGTGDLAVALMDRASQLKATPFIVCSDFTASMMRIGRDKFTKIDSAINPAQPPVPLLGDTMNLPFPDDTFDLVTVAFGIRNVADADSGLREMTRVCKPGGTIAVLEFSETRHPIINGAFSLYFRHILPTIGRVVTGTRAYSYLQKSVEKFPEGEAFAAMLTEATGSTTRMNRLSFGIATLYTSRKSQ